MIWPTVQFGQVCRLHNGRAFKPADWSSEGCPIIRIQNLNNPRNSFNYWNGSCEHQVVVETGAVLLAWSGTPGTSFGAHIWRGPVSVLNQHIFRVDLEESLISKEWSVKAVNYRLNRLIEQAHGGVGLRHVTKGMVEKLEIPLPAVSEQRRIVELLDQADGLRRKRAEADAIAERILPTLFRQMFGDLTSNERSWPTHSLGMSLVEIEGGWSPNCLNRPAKPAEWGVLKLSAVTGNRYDDTENKALPEGLNPDADLEVKDGDLLMTRKNTRELVGAVAYVFETRPRLMLPDLIFRLRLKPTAEIAPLYLWGLLSHPSKRPAVAALAGGSAGSMPNISKGRLATLPVECPPVDLQKRFARAAEKVHFVGKHRARSLENLESLWATLLHLAFTGALTARWREGRMAELLAEMEHQARALGLPAEGVNA